MSDLIKKEISFQTPPSLDIKDSALNVSTQFSSDESFHSDDDNSFESSSDESSCASSSDTHKIAETAPTHHKTSIRDSITEVGSYCNFNATPDLVYQSLQEPSADKQPTTLKFLRKNIFGMNTSLKTPYGRRVLTYCDYTASGKPVKTIERVIAKIVNPIYANTHTEASYTGAYTTRLREEARDQIKLLTGASTEEDKLIFTGYGVTGAIAKLMDVLGVNLFTNRAKKMACNSSGCSISSSSSSSSSTTKKKNSDEAKKNIVVFVGPYEHHSNIVPWRESPIVKVVEIQETNEGQIDLKQLHEQLLAHSAYDVKIGSFSAASNVTGILTDTRSISILLHKCGALAFFDFATAAPYIAIKMNGDRNITDGNNAYDYKDAVFISPHKFIGGPGTPGILIAKKFLFTNPVPSVPGGGTVSYVSPLGHEYYDSIEHREEGGTPSIIGAIRACLAFQLKYEVGLETIHRFEQSYINRAIKRWSSHPNIKILGNPNVPRLGICSFLIKYKEYHFHHNYIVALLNDLFGIQSRGGCMCAGVYGHHLLGVTNEVSEKFRVQIIRGYEGIKPGWTRLNFPYYISESQFQFILTAVEFLADHAQAFLCWYNFSPISGLWRHIEHDDDSKGIPHIWEIKLLKGANDFVSKFSSSSAASSPNIQRSVSKTLSNEYLSVAVRTQSLGTSNPSIQRNKKKKKKKLAEASGKASTTIHDIAPKSPRKKRSRSGLGNNSTSSASIQKRISVASLDGSFYYSEKHFDHLLEGYIEAAHKILKNLKPPEQVKEITFPQECENLRWFHLPHSNPSGKQKFSIVQPRQETYILAKLSRKFSSGESMVHKSPSLTDVDGTIANEIQTIWNAAATVRSFTNGSLSPDENLGKKIQNKKGELRVNYSIKKPKFRKRYFVLEHLHLYEYARKKHAEKGNDNVPLNTYSLLNVTMEISKKTHKKILSHIITLHFPRAKSIQLKSSLSNEDGPLFSWMLQLHYRIPSSKLPVSDVEILDNCWNQKKALSSQTKTPIKSSKKRHQRTKSISEDQKLETSVTGHYTTHSFGDDSFGPKKKSITKIFGM